MVNGRRRSHARGDARPPRVSGDGRQETTHGRWTKGRQVAGVKSQMIDRRADQDHPAPISLPTGRPDHRGRGGEADRRLKERHDQRAVFSGALPWTPDHAGVLIIEAMAQVGGVLLMGTVDDHESKVVYFMSLDNVKFRRPVQPGRPTAVRAGDDARSAGTCARCEASLRSTAKWWPRRTWRPWCATGDRPQSGRRWIHSDRAVISRRCADR